MARGVNVAAPENSHGLYSLLAKQPTHTPVQRERVCVFISHKDADTPAAIEIGNHITEDLGFDIYLDVYDRTLQKADKASYIACPIFCVLVEESFPVRNVTSW